MILLAIVPSIHSKLASNVFFKEIECLDGGVKFCALIQTFFSADRRAILSVHHENSFKKALLLTEYVHCHFEGYSCGAVPLA